MRIRTVAAVAAAAAIGVAAVGSTATARPQPTAKAEQDIVQTATAAGQFKTLTALLGRAGLAPALQGRASYTVFAPTDAAFAKVPKATLDALAKDKAKLRAVLLYHVAKGRLTAARVVKRDRVRTLNGQSLRIRASGGKVTVGGATVVTPNVRASNGVIHVIDKVLIPR